MGIIRRSTVMVHHQRNHHSTSMTLVFTPLESKKVQKDKRMKMDGMENPTTLAKPIGARVTRTPSISLTKMLPNLSLDMVSHPRVPTPLIWVDSSLSVPRDKVIHQLAPKIPMTRPVVIESFS